MPQVGKQLIKESTKENSNKGKDPLTHLRLNINKPNNTLKLKNTTTHETDKIIRTLKTKDSYGYDGISTRILKISALYVVSPLTYITNKIMSSGIFPDRLKYSDVKPLYKKADASDLSNYRPISLLISFFKVIEKILHKNYMTILTNKKYLLKSNMVLG